MGSIGGSSELEGFSYANRFIGVQVELAILKTAIELDIPEIMRKHGEPMKLSEIAASLTQIPASKHEALRRVMQSLCTMQLVASDDGGKVFMLTPAGLYYARGYEKTMVHLLKLTQTKYNLRMWDSLASWLGQEEVESSFEMGNGNSLWECVSKDPEYNEVFNNSMKFNSSLVWGALIRNCPQVFDGAESILDVGGGSGGLARAICAAFPGIKGTVFDLPHVVKDLQASDGVNFVGGDIFESSTPIPKADIIVLKTMLHDWDDENCLKILKRCKEALNDGGKILILEMVLNMAEEDVSIKRHKQCMHVTMLGFFGIGKERTEKEWGLLLSNAGFNHHQIENIKVPQSLIVAYP